jgi:hypothetical protein
MGFFWRKGWDSNPRYPCRHAGFQDRCLKPLGHPSNPLKLFSYYEKARAEKAHLLPFCYPTSPERLFMAARSTSSTAAAPSPDAGRLGMPKLGRQLHKPTPIAKAGTTQTEVSSGKPLVCSSPRLFVSKKDEPDSTPAATVALFVRLASIKRRLRAQWGRAALVCPSSFQCELFAKFGRDGVGAFLNGLGMLGRGNHRSAPAEDRVLATDTYTPPINSF